MNYRHFTLRERASTLQASASEPCAPKRRCALLQACLDVSAGRRREISLEQFIATGKSSPRAGARIVIWIRGQEYAALTYCPFCGNKIEL